MAESSPQSRHGEIRLLLPWYANGTLDAVDRERVAEHVSSCDVCARELAQHERLREAVRVDDAVPIVPSRRVDDVLGFRRRPAGDKAATSRSGWLIAAGIACIAVLAGFVGYALIVDERPGTRFETATSTRANGSRIDYVVEIEFQETSSDVERQALLESLGAIDIITDGSGTRVRLTVPNQPAALGELENYAQRLREHPAVEAADIIALQLPVH